MPSYYDRNAVRLYNRSRRHLVARLLKETGIRTGSIVRSRDDNRLYVLVKPMTNCLHLRRLTDEAHKSSSTPSPDSPEQQLDVTLEYNPPEGWVHPLAVQPHAIDDSGEFAKVCRDLRGFVNERLTMRDRRTSEHGVLWRVSTVEPLIAEFDGEREQQAMSWN